MSDTENPFRPPESELREAFDHSGGSLESGLRGDYELQIGEILKEAWRRTSGLKGSFWGGFIVMYLLLLVIGAGVGFLIGVSSQDLESPAIGLAFQLVLMAFIYPMVTGFIMMGVHRSVDLPVSFTMIFDYWPRTLTILLASILMLVLTWIGLILLILPGIYLTFAYVLALPLIADRHLGAWRAMETSRKAVTKHWFKVFFLLLCLLPIHLLGIITIIGWIWTFPMFLNVFGILYREVFGVEMALED